MTARKEWLLQQIRLSLFPSLEEKFDTKVELWPEIDGVDPGTQTIDRKTGAVTYEGFYDKQKLVLVVTPIKIDLVQIVASPVRMEEGNAVIEHFGVFSEGKAKFQQVAKALLENKNVPDITRIAFGSQLVKDTTSRNEVYQLLSDYTPFDLDPNKMSDFQFQLNLHTKSNIIKDLKLNRLTKWTAAKLNPELSVADMPGVVQKLPIINLAMLELDINTNQENKDKIPTNKLSELYEELEKLGEDISKKGIKDHAAS